jgi:hypothetical protein
MSSINPNNPSNNGQVNEQAARSEGSSRDPAAPNNLISRELSILLSGLADSPLPASELELHLLLSREISELAAQRVRRVSELREQTARSIGAILSESSSEAIAQRATGTSASKHFPFRELPPKLKPKQRNFKSRREVSLGERTQENYERQMEQRAYLLGLK